MTRLYRGLACIGGSCRRCWRPVWRRRRDRAEVSLVGCMEHCRIKGIPMAGTSGYEVSRADRHVRRKRSFALAMLVVTGVINYLDRSTLSIANQQIREDLGLSLGEMGILLSAFSW